MSEVGVLISRLNHVAWQVGDVFCRIASWPADMEARREAGYRRDMARVVGLTGWTDEQAHERFHSRREAMEMFLSLLTDECVKNGGRPICLNADGTWQDREGP